MVLSASSGSGLLGQFTPLVHSGRNVTKRVLDLDRTLFSGQAFTWEKDPAAAEFWGVACSNYLEFKYGPEDVVLWRGYSKRSSRDEIANWLIDYFALNLDYDEVFKDICDKDPKFKDRFEVSRGHRVMRQDPWECFIGFLCSQNNNIKRISQMVKSICKSFGDVIIENTDRGTFYEFPTPEVLAELSETSLNNLGFGYRSKYIINSSKQLLKLGGREYLSSLRPSDQRSKERKLPESLTQFAGVGPKVCDCVSLFALDRLDTVPVDTHMYQYCKRAYNYTGSYEGVRKVLQDRLGGKYAGIGHSFVFHNEIAPQNKESDGLLKKGSEIEVKEEKSKEKTVSKAKSGIPKMDKVDTAVIKHAKSDISSEITVTSKIQTRAMKRSNPPEITSEDELQLSKARKIKPNEKPSK